MQYIVYIFFRINKFIFSIIPFRLLYLFSDAFSLLLQYIVRYRRTCLFRTNWFFVTFGDAQIFTKNTAQIFDNQINMFVFPW